MSAPFVKKEGMTDEIEAVLKYLGQLGNLDTQEFPDPDITKAYNEVLASPVAERLGLSKDPSNFDLVKFLFQYHKDVEEIVKMLPALAERHGLNFGSETGPSATNAESLKTKIALLERLKTEGLVGIAEGKKQRIISELENMKKETGKRLEEFETPRLTPEG